MTTVHTMTKFSTDLEAAGISLRHFVGTSRALKLARCNRSKLARVRNLHSTYAVMWGAGIRPSDYITPKSKGSTATTEQWADRYAVASRLCYSLQSWPNWMRQWPKMQP
jgi:hypothetical protein